VCLATDIFVGGTVIVQNLLFLLFIHGLCPPVIWIDMIDWFRCLYMIFSRYLSGV
jgi:hypothetical protein